MNIFISIPMSGRPDIEIKEEIKHIENLFMDYISDTNPDEHVEFIDNLDNDVDPSRCVDLVNEPLLYLGEAIRKMAFCDAILLAPGYHKARGCLIEKQIADSYGISRFNLQTDYQTKCRITLHANNEACDTWTKEFA